MPEWVICAVHVILFVSKSSTLANSLNSQSQNAINPRNSSTEIPREGETCQFHNTNSLTKSPCKMPCVKDDDCINHGQRTCCPTLPGSSCIRECLAVERNSERTTKTCIDVRSRKRYIVGETFVMEDKCCTCLAGRINCASAIKTCHLGCWKNSKYFKHGESIASRSCHNCSCNNGSVICSSDVKCLQGKCSYRGKLYGEGDVVDLQGGCKECVCHSGRWNCVELTCYAARSKANLGAYSPTEFLLMIMCTLLSSSCR
ncbi:hypothetical protein ACROYT_G040559 [Oculina patagonica]